ncbi:MAG: phage terminase large subunit family protein [Nitrosopumilus sp.]
MINLFQEALVDGLHRNTLSIPSIWAEHCRIMGEPFPGPYSFKYHPWTKEMLNTDHEQCVGQKAAQMGYTEVMLNRALFTIDQLRRDVLYVLPNLNPDAGDFSQSRFDPALELSGHLSSMFSDVDKVGLKRSGDVCLFIRGSRSRAQLKSIPVALIILDEADEMDQESIVLVDERRSGQTESQSWMISTPHIPNYGINYHYENSTKEIFVFKCPHCSKFISLDFPDCLEIIGDDPTDSKVLESYLKCPECKLKLDHEEKIDLFKEGTWQSQYPDRMVRGFHINQLYSNTVSPGKIAIMYLKSLSNPTYEQEFFNSKLGLPHIVSGARITQEHIDSCIGEYKNMCAKTSGLPITMGIDVGRNLHWRVSEWHLNKKGADINDAMMPKVIGFGKIYKSEDAGFSEIDEIIKIFKPNRMVIDALPETRSSQVFCNRFKGKATACYYNHNIKAKSLSYNEEEHTVTVNRTAWLDQSLSRFRNEDIRLPLDIDKEFKDHQQALVRVYKQDNFGQDQSQYLGNAADHYAHAGLYEEVALKLLISEIGVPGTIESPL